MNFNQIWVINATWEPSGVARVSGAQGKKWNWCPFRDFSGKISKMVDPKQIQVIFKSEKKKKKEKKKVISSLAGIFLKL